MITNSQLTQQEAHKAITSGKTRILTFLNTQTGSAYIYKVVQAEYDPIDPMSYETPPQFIFSYIGNNEWAYMGALYQGKDYMHKEEEGIFPNDYPCVKVWRYMIKMMVVNKPVKHIEIYDGNILTTDYAEREVNLDCEQVSHLQYGTKVPVIITGKKAKHLADDFIVKKNTNQMYKYLKEQFV